IRSLRSSDLLMAMRQPMLIHPVEARRESANNIQAAVRLDNRLESQRDQIAPPLKTNSMRAHEIKIDKSDRFLNSEDNHTGLNVGALAASTIFALFAISAMPWPFASTSGKRSESSQNLGSSVSPLVPKQVDRLPINGTIT